MKKLRKKPAPIFPTIIRPTVADRVADQDTARKPDLILQVTAQQLERMGKRLQAELKQRPRPSVIWEVFCWADARYNDGDARQNNGDGSVWTNLNDPAVFDDSPGAEEPSVEIGLGDDDILQVTTRYTVSQAAPVARTDPAEAVWQVTLVGPDGWQEAWVRRSRWGADMDALLYMLSRLRARAEEPKGSVF